MIQPVTYYICTCDRCGYTWQDTANDWTAFSDQSFILDMVEEDDTWYSNDGEHYCPDCFTTDDEGEHHVKPNSEQQMNGAIADQAK